MPETTNDVRTDEYGAMRVGSTRVSLDSVVIAFQQGESPEGIQQNYPALTLEEVEGAIAYYLANKEEVNKYLRRQDELWKKRRAEADANPSPVVQRLRAVLRERESTHGS